MDSRVILKRVNRTDLVSLPELKKLRLLKPTLTASNPLHHRARVTLIVPTYFNSDLKGGSLNHLLAGIAQSEVIREIVLVCSDHLGGSAGKMTPLGDHQVLRMCQAEPAQRGGSRNVGAASATSEYLLFLDDDMLLKNWRCVDVTLSELVAGSYDCALFPRRQYARFPLLYDDASLATTIDHWRAGTANGAVYDPLRSGTCDLPMLFCFPGCFMLVRRDAFHRLGGFDSSFRGWGFEDTEFGLRAMRQLRVLNLFHRAEPLLHIDHPVSPYKSEEHRLNYSKFFRSADAVDMHRFCRTVLLCPDLPREQARLLRPAIHSEVFKEVADGGIPLDVTEIECWAAQVAQKRLHALLHPRPEFIVLHGSRATGRAKPDSDYDVLALYRGTIQEFFVTRNEPRVEVECADLDIFSCIAGQPWLVGLHGVMELAKVAQARLLWGRAADWKRWRARILKAAVRNGLLYWRVLTIGLRLHREKYGVMLARFLGSLNAVLVAAGLPDASHQLFGIEDEAFIGETAAMIEVRLPKWRRQVARGETIFELQTPEVWSALHFLACRANATAASDADHAIRPVAAMGPG